MINKNYKHTQTGDAKKWKAHFATQEKSRLSRSKYCRRQHISYHTFAYWLRKLSITGDNNFALIPITYKLNPVWVSTERVADLILVLQGKITITGADHTLP